MPDVYGEADYAWLAGVWDGEGCVHRNVCKGVPYPIWQVNQAVTPVDAADDPDGPPELLRRTAAILDDLGVRHRTVLYRPSKKLLATAKVTSTLPLWHQRVSGYPTLLILTATCWPWLGKVKKVQAIKHMDAFAEFRGLPPFPYGLAGAA